MLQSNYTFVEKGILVLAIGQNAGEVAGGKLGANLAIHIIRLLCI
jgi:hypothetical protein